MSESSLKPPVQNIGLASEHVTDYEVFGSEVVQHDEAAVTAMLHMGFYGDSQQYVNHFKGLPDPRYQSRINRVGRALLGRPNADKELANWLHTNQHMNLELVPTHLNNWQETQATVLDREQQAIDRHMYLARRKLLDLTPLQNAELTEYFDSYATPFLKTWFSDWKQARTKQFSGDEKAQRMATLQVSDWLTELPTKLPLDENDGKPHLQLLNFMQWHEQRMTRINQSPEVRDMIAGDRARYIDAMQQLIDDGKVKNIPEDWQERVAQIPVYIGDVFDMALHGAGGLYQPEHGRILLMEDSPESVFRHEMTHHMGELQYIFLNEAATDHLTFATFDGVIDSFKPSPSREDQGYEARCRVMDNILNAGTNFINAGLVIEAYFEANAAGPITKQLKSEIDTAFNGVNMELFILKQFLHYRKTIPHHSEASDQLMNETIMELVANSVIVLAGLQKQESIEDIMTKMYLPPALVQSLNATELLSYLDSLIGSVETTAEIQGAHKYLIHN